MSTPTQDGFAGSSSGGELPPNSARRLRHFLRVNVGWLLALALGGSLTAQTRVYVLEAGDQYRPVYKVSGGLPYLKENDRLVPAKGDRFALVKAEEYLPVLVTVHNRQSRTVHVKPDDSSQILNSFQYGAEFESPEALADVFAVLEFDLPNTGKSLYVYEVGALAAGTPKPFAVGLTLDRNLNVGECTLHLYAGGAEVFTTEQSPAYREEMLDRMVAKRIAGLQQAGPRPFFGPAPRYPAGLLGSGVSGEVVVTMRITRTGAVLDPVITRASAPAFGEAALAAVRQWRFLPRVAGGRAVEIQVSLPLTFDPPPAGG